MSIPKPSQTKQPILNYLAKAGKPVKVSAITELVGQHFNLSKKEMEERSLKGTKRLAMCITASTQEMKTAGLISSPRFGFLEITPKGRGGLAGSTTQAGTITSGRKKRGRPPKVKTEVATNGRRKPGRPPKSQTAAQLPSAKQTYVPIKRDDKLVQRTADIVISYVGKNSVDAKQVPGMIESVYAALQGLGLHFPKP